jgi:glycosyltransferase involved in cell wall biosynthesis
MQQVHVYVSPLVIEGDGGAGLSNSIIEAMVTKTPVCSYEAIAHGEIVIDGETGFLIEANNNQALVNAVIETLDNPAATTKRVENAYTNIIEQCDPDSFSKKLISLYEQM